MRARSVSSLSAKPLKDRRPMMEPAPLNQAEHGFRGPAGKVGGWSRFWEFSLTIYSARNVIRSFIDPKRSDALSRKPNEFGTPSAKSRPFRTHLQRRVSRERARQPLQNVRTSAESSVRVLCGRSLSNGLLFSFQPVVLPERFSGQIKPMFLLVGVYPVAFPDPFLKPGSRFFGFQPVIFPDRFPEQKPAQNGSVNQG